MCGKIEAIDDRDSTVSFSSPNVHIGFPVTRLRFGRDRQSRTEAASSPGQRYHWPQTGAESRHQKRGENHPEHGQKIPHVGQLDQ